MLTDRPMNDGAPLTLEVPEDPTGPFANSPFARCLPALWSRSGQLRQSVDRQAGPARRRFRSAGLAGRSYQAHRFGVWPFHAEEDAVRR